MGAEIELTPEILSTATAREPIAELTDGGEWRLGVKVSAGQTVRYKGVSYKCIQEHLTQASWLPDATVSLWAKVREDCASWVQPQGANDAYAEGTIVTHGGKTWLSNLDNNVWGPGVYGWTEIT